MKVTPASALVAALLADDGTAEWTAAVPGRLETLLAALPASARAGVRGAAWAIDTYAVARTGARLAALGGPERERVVSELASRRALLPLLDAVKVPVLLAAGTERALHRAPTPSPSRPAPIDPPLELTPARDWPTRSTADAVVVGSGAGGAMAARTLARAGMRVVVLEEGEHHSTASFGRRAPLDRFTDLYRDGGATIALGNPPLVLPVGRAVGGTTVVNSGTCYRTPAHVVSRWLSRYGFAVAEGFDVCLDEVERTLRVARQPLDVIGTNGRLALAGAEELGWAAGPLRRNAPGCRGSCQCVVGCPTGAKQSVQLSVLPDACASGARIVTGARVRRILVDPDRPGGPRASGVVVSRQDGSELEILSPVVVVAAGALQTPQLLRRSGLGRHPGVGRNLSVHPAVSVAGRFGQPVTDGAAVLQSVGVEQLHSDGILIEATAAPPGMTSFVLPGVGRPLRRELDTTEHLATFGAMIADQPSGRVLGRERTLLRYDLSPRDAARLLRAQQAMGDLLFAAGAEEVLTGVPQAPRASTPHELKAVLSSVSARQLHVSAFHPTGTAAAGSDPGSSPTDPDGRLRGVHGVLIADGSVLPSCPEVNPQLSIMAAALAVSERYVAQM
ncbi:putative GMC-type oxidoreductase [Streptomyces davaonensis JCM 4913]|uniref:Putative GMC-type oxidoreductase n=1 Tax=Streptomyces davaonensis (strain DSM 101723 / JCM 4913 / KCC S-0913 / 768) TaxID=1214101 RepID=K4QW70_STRDJ|nr:GMC family oxidoreductase [Streptomyces davaonensis]CCK25080.1 putative GMC-type oxidoreductase [Streptomyces davaonensis JCM 4913]